MLEFLALGILVPWALACAKDTFRYVGHCGLVFEEFRFFGPWDFTFRLFGPWGLDVGILLVGSLRFLYMVFGNWVFGILEFVLLFLFLRSVGFWELGFWKS